MRNDNNCLCQDTLVASLWFGALNAEGLIRERRGTAIMAYAFLASLVAIAATVSFHATGSAVTALYDVIATTVVASMPQ